MILLSFSKIKNSSAPLTHIEREVEINSEFLKRSQKILFAAKNIRISGDLFYDEPYVTGNFKITTDVVIPSSRSLKPVNYHEEFSFSENYTQEITSKDELRESTYPIVKIEDDQINLQKAIEDNILLNIPTTVLTPTEKENNLYPKGQDWEVVSESDFDKGKKNQLNPAFAKLKVLLKNKNDNSDK